jgi:hypothetical protein
MRERDDPELAEAWRLREKTEELVRTVPVPDAGYDPADCWCGMDHARMDMDGDGNWYELPEEDA